MIEEAYVSLETAKLLKEKGFDEYCLFCYEQNVFSHTTNFTLKRALYRDILIGIKNSEFEENAIHNVFTAPSQSLALKWLREEHHLLIKIIWTGYEDEFSWDVDSMENGDYFTNIDEECQTYEKAVEAALKYCLTKLI